MSTYLHIRWVCSLFCEVLCFLSLQWPRGLHACIIKGPSHTVRCPQKTPSAFRWPWCKPQCPELHHLLQSLHPSREHSPPCPVGVPSLWPAGHSPRPASRWDQGVACWPSPIAALGGGTTQPWGTGLHPCGNDSPRCPAGDQPPGAGDGQWLLL